ncbi:4-hydroxyphenylpyruvate dioxygenase [Aaosphaeria arxii CBS 175.79]|uniref:4-hydroxyphenylpyruvate dioxygenase n=1 Tax=Aaosphaeria arxii CBS 175.79 TaxID=1450172 RepID=A0A6A5XVS3_9PLEO|nr:4-hydroxyphenylpyruvate dioxygenase [Aaosphaeria arxii CBS 175.79]KAF2017059.1 4-hydroxyphenylpyruvate dioxygenase [Aaosphaeria arxii CBS 175.79]
MQVLKKNKFAIGTSSLGLHPTHLLDQKLHAAAKHGFTGVEIVYQDLSTYSTHHSLPILTAAQHIHTLCTTLNLTILSLCPFENYEGALSPLSSRLALASTWLTIARALQTPHIQVPAQFAQETSSTPLSTIVSDLQALADLAASESPAIRIAYEPMSWSVHHSTWESLIPLLTAVDRPNFGVCIDTFHLASKLWGNPRDAVTGKYPGADEALRDSLERFVRDFPLEKLFYIQLSDGERFEDVYSKSHPWYVEGEAMEFSWSRHGRPFPGESELGAYFPMEEMVRALVVEKGFEGWVSFETFDRRMRGEGVGVEKCAERAERSLRWLDGELAGAKEKL